MPQLSDDMVMMAPAALQFAGDVEVGSNGEDAKTAPLRIVALSGDPVFHSSWNGDGSYVVLDFAGMSLEKPRLPVDYCHDADEVIGYVNKFDVGNDLVASGALIPYSPDPQDKATEVIYKSQQGIPYQASVYFADDFLVERLSAGQADMVNGRMVEGPIDVVRQWKLRGIAVCPYGVDGGTSTETSFSRNRKVRARVRQFSQEKSKMSESATAEAKVEETTAVEAAAVNGKVEATTSETVETVVEEATKPVVAETTTETKPAETQLSSKGEGHRFLTAFGDKGGVWFAQGKSFEEARDLHATELAATNTKLATENASLRKQLGDSRGEEKPVSFSSGDKGKPNKNHQNLTPGLSRFAADLEGKVAALNGHKGDAPAVVTKK